jgi:peptidoglycan/LPS O-acetylase OafA/YrhL
MMMVFGGTLSVDTFFLLSGFLMGYLTLKHLDKAKTINPLMMYLHRYIRLTPAYGLIMLVLSTIILHFGSGPTWNFMERQADTCQENWWTNLLYINNFVNSDQ